MDSLSEIPFGPSGLRHLGALLNGDQTKDSQPTVLTDLMSLLAARDL